MLKLSTIFIIQRLVQITQGHVKVVVRLIRERQQDVKHDTGFIYQVSLKDPSQVYSWQHSIVQYFQTLPQLQGSEKSQQGVKAFPGPPTSGIWLAFSTSVTHLEMTEARSASKIGLQAHSLPSPNLT
uniref:Uncharacterized protein n=1 Tax=Physcomitrium patens TaxID=3218 RepID=A0A2K1JVD1_PHYPA|nr:hypothetical protein PHYPA_015252 [Physcomitrium patens]